MGNNQLNLMRRLKKEKKSIPIDKQKEIFYNLVAERIAGGTEKLHNSFNFQNLIYHFKGPTKDKNFNDFIHAETLFDDIKSKKDVEKKGT